MNNLRPNMANCPEAGKDFGIGNPHTLHDGQTGPRNLVLNCRRAIPEKLMRRLLIACLALLAALPALAAERWQTLPPTPAPIATDRSGQADVNGIRIHYAIYGKGTPVIFLHGGLANSDYWGKQVPAISAHHTVILMDSRGHGRSTRDRRPYGYDLMADDVVALMDYLKIAKADIVGWSDGGILGIDLAMRHKERVGKVFAFAANTVTAGLKGGVGKNPTFAAYIARASKEYAERSSTPGEYGAFVKQISRMWAEQPNWSAAQLKTIDTPVLVVDGDHDEAIRLDHTETIAATIPHAGLLILPNTSHFAFLQDPQGFNFAILHFLGDE
jgi:pimeloyl-ACP methyl ester carboxylesterase